MLAPRRFWWAGGKNGSVRSARVEEEKCGGAAPVLVGRWKNGSVRSARVGEKECGALRRFWWASGKSGSVRSARVGGKRSVWGRRADFGGQVEKADLSDPLARGVQKSSPGGYGWTLPPARADLSDPLAQGVQLDRTPQARTFLYVPATINEKVLAWGVRLDPTPCASRSVRSARAGGSAGPYPLDEDFSRTARVERADLKDSLSISLPQFLPPSPSAAPKIAQPL